MSYTLTFRKRAASEYIEAAAWYNVKSIKTAENFVRQVNVLLDQIEQQPISFVKVSNISTKQKLQDILIRLFISLTKK